MKAKLDLSWWALGTAAVFFAWVMAQSSSRTALAPGAMRRLLAAPGATAATGQPAVKSMAPAMSHTTSNRPVTDYSRTIVKAVHESGDASAGRLLAWIDANLPPGWEDTFLLHDALVASGALTDMARVLSFASSRGLEARPRGALEGEALRIQGMADAIVRRWLSSKHPLLGDSMIERVLSEPSREVMPVLGEYNLVPAEELVRILGVSAKSASGVTEQ